jgi:alpha-D-xyloside xylohydrolase
VLDSAPVTLGQGLHGLRLLDLPADLAPDAPLLVWEGPAGSGVVPDRYLFRRSPSGNGLLGTYYRGSEWAPPVFMQRLDPILVAAWPEDEPMYGPFSVIWTGELLAPVDGLYQIQINADDGARLWLDGRVLAEGMVPDTANVIRTSMKLTAGPHPIRIDYFQRGGGKSLEFFWRPPGLPMQPVSAQYLRPADS